MFLFSKANSQKVLILKENKTKQRVQWSNITLQAKSSRNYQLCHSKFKIQLNPEDKSSRATPSIHAQHLYRKP